MMGALISIASPNVELEPGDTGTIIRNGESGRVRVRHTQRNSDSTERVDGVSDQSLLVGVEFVDVERVFPDLTRIVGNLRDSGNKLEDIWKHAR